MGFMLKMLGVFGVSTAVMALIWIKIKEKRKAIDFVSDFISSLKYIENIISFSAIPFSSVLDKTIEMAMQSRDFFIKVADGLKSADNPTLNEVWQRALDVFAEGNKLSPKTVDIIRRLGSRLGVMSIEVEIENLSLAQAELFEEKQKLILEFEKESKLLKSMGLALGGFIILIFI